MPELYALEDISLFMRAPQFALCQRPETIFSHSRTETVRLTQFSGVLEDG